MRIVAIAARWFSIPVPYGILAVLLTFVLALAYGVLKVMKARMQPRATPGGGPDDSVRFVRALPVGTKERVVIVEHRGERWMLGVTAGGISTIAHWADGAEKASAIAAPAPRLDTTPDTERS